MSQHQCQEPGCGYTIGISPGPNLTEEDWKAEQYYFDEIAAHEQEHAEQYQKESCTYELRAALERSEGEEITVDRAELERLLDWADSATRKINEFVAWADSCPGSEKPPAVAPAEGYETESIR